MIPLRTAAIPSYLPVQFDDAAPGHRFQMYFSYWKAGRFTAYKDARLPDIKDRAKNDRDRIGKQFDAEKKAPLGETCPLGSSAKAALAGLRQRQKALIAAYGDDGFRIAATSTAPFATGLGNEHPIENGFAFLTPYGLPYLAGSGVKGVLRQAAEELALFPDEYAPLPHPGPLPGGEGENQPAQASVSRDLALLDIWWLFGFEGAAGAIWENDNHHSRAFEAALPAIAARGDLRAFIAAIVADKKVRAHFLDSGEDSRLAFLQRLQSKKTFRQSLSYRGALDFWDVFPAPKGDRLVVEIMTPHHAGYFMEGKAPHDAESPIPVPFLAVPAGSTFDFHVVCAASRLPDPLRANWPALLRGIFAHAFDWLGFGAKTAVGYGAMNRAEDGAAQAGNGGAAPRQTEKPAEPEIVWDHARLKFNKNNGTLTATERGGAQAHALRPDGQRLLETLPPEIRQKVTCNDFVRVCAKVRGGELVAVKPAQ